MANLPVQRREENDEQQHRFRWVWVWSLCAVWAAEDELRPGLSASPPPQSSAIWPPPPPRRPLVPGLGHGPRIGDQKREQPGRQPQCPSIIAH
ncbi:unnamed protein product [Lota lota]